jgi:putative salt-induced outer membrane protein YdiY
MKLLRGILSGAVAALPLVGLAEEEAKPEVEWKSNLALGATYKSGNSDKSLFTANLKADRFGTHNDVLMSLYAEYGKTGTQTTPKEQTEGQVLGKAEYRHKFGGSKLFFGVFAEGLNDSIKQIRFRGKVGPNIGYYIIDNETMKWDASFGVNYVYERVGDPVAGPGNDIERTYGEYRVASNFAWDFTENGSYYLNVEYTANMEDTDVDNGGLLVTGLKGKVATDLSMFIELRDEYDNLPDTAGADHNDLTVMAGLSYDF